MSWVSTQPAEPAIRQPTAIHRAAQLRPAAMARCRRQDVRRGNCGLTSILRREPCPAANAPRIARPIRGWHREESFVRLSLQQCFLTYHHSSGGHRARTVPVPTIRGAIRPPLARRPPAGIGELCPFYRGFCGSHARRPFRNLTKISSGFPSVLARLRPLGHAETPRADRRFVAALNYA